MSLARHIWALALAASSVAPLTLGAACATTPDADNSSTPTLAPPPATHSEALDLAAARIVAALENELSDMRTPELVGRSVCVALTRLTDQHGNVTEGTHALSYALLDAARGSRIFDYKPAHLSTDFAYLKAPTAAALDEPRLALILRDTACFRVVVGTVAEDPSTSGATVSLRIVGATSHRLAPITITGYTHGKQMVAAGPPGALEPTRLRVFIIRGPNTFEGTETQRPVTDPNTQPGQGTPNGSPTPASPQAAPGARPGSGIHGLPAIPGMPPSLLQSFGFAPGAQTGLAADLLTQLGQGAPPATAPDGTPKTPVYTYKSSSKGGVQANVWDLNVRLNGTPYIESSLITRLEGLEPAGRDALLLIDQTRYAGQKVTLDVSFFSRLTQKVMQRQVTLTLTRDPITPVYVRFDAQYGVDLLDPDAGALQTRPR